MAWRLVNPFVKIVLMSDLMSIYKNGLRRYAETHDPALVTNKGVEYAVAFYCELFRNTSAIARIFCEGAHSEIWHSAEFQKEFEEMVKRGVDIELLTEENPELRTDLPDYLKRLHSSNPTRIKMRHISNEGRQLVEDELGGEVNFAVFDKDKYRFEYDKRGYKAFGSFNDEGKCAVYSSRFDRLYDMSENSDLTGHCDSQQNVMISSTSPDVSLNYAREAN